MTLPEPGLEVRFGKDIAYAQRLAHPDVPTELVLYPGTFHGARWSTRCKDRASAT